MIDAIERFGEQLYRKWWFRALLLIFFFLFHCYVALWVHEFWHYWWGSLIDETKCHIVYAPFGIRGWTYCGRFSLANYAVGGLGTAVVFFIYWFFAASFPSKLSLPYDLSLFYVVVNQLIYTPFEVAGLGLNHPEIYQFYWLSTAASFIFVIVIYLDRIKKFVGGDAEWMRAHC